MLKKTITYVDYEGVQRTEDFFFNLSQAELVEMEVSRKGGLSSIIKRVIAAQDFTTIVEIFKELIVKSYGEKSPDGRQFIKNQEVLERFTQTEAFSILFMELATSSEKAIDFLKGVAPSGVDFENIKKDIDKSNLSAKTV